MSLSSITQVINGSEYTDPRWEQLRQAKIRHSGNKCDSCRLSGKPLQVHHNYYVRGRKLWDYNLDELRCLCVACHKQFHEAKQDLLRNVAPRMTAQEFQTMVRMINIAIGQNKPLHLAYAIGYLADKPGRVDYMAQEVKA